MIERAIHIGVLTWATVLESLRRKDLYVVWLLSLASLAAGAILARTGIRGYETFVRDVTLTVVNVLSVAICIWLAARQLPEELSRRTLFPLLARPVHRVDVLAGKLLGVWMLSTVALLVLGGIGWLNLAANRAGVGPIFYQFLFLRALSFGPIAAMTIAISLAASGPATVVTSGLLTFGASIFARTLADATDTAVPWLQPAMRAVYFCVPHLDLFDLSQRVAFNYQPIPFWAIAALTAYGAGYTAVFLGLGSIRFREMAV